MNATKFLKGDHDKMKALFEKLDATDDQDRMQELYDELEENLIAHTQVEEEIFYPACRKIEGMEELVEEALAAHHSVDAICDDLAEAVPGEEAFLGRLKAMKDALLHHIQEEENELFPRVEKGLSRSRLDDMGKELSKRKNEILAREPVEAK